MRVDVGLWSGGRGQEVRATIGPGAFVLPGCSVFEMVIESVFVQPVLTRGCGTKI